MNLNILWACEVEKMKKANKFADEFIKGNKEILALLGLAGISLGIIEDKQGLFTKFAQHCKENGISREEASIALSELINEANQ